MNKPGKLDAFAENAEQTARRGQMIQEEVDRAGKKGAARTEKRNGAMQAGARQYPDSFPKQHLKKPGLESELHPSPMYQAPHYRGSGKLEGMIALITGGAVSAHLIDRGIRVNAIAPGPVWTPLNPADRAGQHVAKFGNQTAMMRAAQPEEIAPAFVFMAAPSCSSYITGEILPIVGGYPAC